MSTPNLNSFEEQAQRIWAAKTLEDKRIVFLEVIHTLKYKEKIPSFIRSIKAAKKSFDLDKLAANIMNFKDNAVVGLLPR